MRTNEKNRDTKICTKCKIELPIDRFSLHKRNPDGLQYWCKDCISFHRQENREINVLSTCVICKKLMICRRKDRLYCDGCVKLRHKQGMREYRKTPKGRLSDLKRRANKNKVWHNFTPEEWDAKLQKTKGICPMCKQYIGIDRLTLDHIIPISRAPIGAVYTIDDIQPLCMKCNVGKSDKVSGKVLLRSEPKRLRRKLRNNYKMEVSIVKHSKKLYGKIIELMEDKTPKFTEDEIIFLNSLK